MLKKLQLKLADAYEICVAAEKVADMVVKFALGRKHYREIGCETGDVPTWDDLVIEHSDQTLEHFQIKRNFTDFSDHACDRIADPVHKGKPNQRLRDLSPLDESMASLADWATKYDPASEATPKKFTIELPAASILIKDGLAFRHFQEFITSISNSTTAASLDQIALTHSPTKNIHLWLTTWCRFTSWDHILKVCRHMNIVLAGNESAIEARTESLLAYCFSQPDEVRKKINSFITENSTLTSKITPRPLLGELRSFWLPGLILWTEYINRGLTWDVGGICDPDFNQIERAEMVVDENWQQLKQSQIKITCNAAGHSPLPSALKRMVLHMPGTTVAMIKDLQVWLERTLTLVGGTLGDHEEDCEDLSVLELSTHFEPTDIRPITSSTFADNEGQSLDKRMDELTWTIVKSKLEAKITAIPAGDLRVAIEERWNSWLPKLNGDPTACAELCRQMLHPNAEGKGIVSSLRHGPKTTLLLAKGLLLLLATAVAVSDTDEGWVKVSSLTVGTKALKRWSGPAEGTRQSRNISDEGIEILIGRETSKLLVLSGVENSITQTLDKNLGEGSEPSYSLADGRQPMLITYSGKVKQALKEGNLSMLKQHIGDMISTAATIRQQQIKNLAQ